MYTAIDCEYCYKTWLKPKHAVWDDDEMNECVCPACGKTTYVSNRELLPRVNGWDF